MCATGLAYTFFSEQDGKYAPELIKVLESANQKVPSELRDIAARSGSLMKGHGGRWDYGGRGGRDMGRDFGVGRGEPYNGGRGDSFGGRGRGASGGRFDRNDRGGYGGRGRYEREQVFESSRGVRWQRWSVGSGWGSEFGGRGEWREGCEVGGQVVGRRKRREGDGWKAGIQEGIAQEGIAQEEIAQEGIGERQGESSCWRGCGGVWGQCAAE